MCIQDLPHNPPAICPKRAEIGADGRAACGLRPVECGGPGDFGHEDRQVDVEVPALPRVDEALEVRSPPGGEHPDSDSGHRVPQCLNSRIPVKTIAIPCASAAAITSSSRIDPPGWATTATPPFASSSMPSRNGKYASLTATLPRAAPFAL